MKKLFLLLSACLLAFGAMSLTSSSVAFSSAAKSFDSISTQIKDSSRTDYWLGKDGKTRYKIDKTTNKLSTSTDGQKWTEVKDGMWQDKDGKWLKIENKKLLRSDDNGKSWNTVSDGRWQGYNGKSYQFDKDWNLWER